MSNGVYSLTVFSGGPFTLALTLAISLTSHQPDTERDSSQPRNMVQRESSALIPQSYSDLRLPIHNQLVAPRSML